MDFLQIALIFLIALMSVFLSVLGIQVFFILRNLRQALEKFEKMLDEGYELIEEVERPVAEVAKAVEMGTKVVRKVTASKLQKRFFRKIR